MQIGNILLNLHTVDRNKTTYASATNSVSHTDIVALSRSERARGSNDPLRTQVRFERGFVAGDPAAKQEKMVYITINASVYPGLDEASVKAYIADALTQSATTVSTLAVTGDIQLGN